MRRIRIKRNRRGLLGIGILVVVICGVLSYNTWITKTKVRANQEVLDSLNQTKKELLKEREQIKEDQEITDQDIERIAREKLGLVYEDEIVLEPEN